MNPGTTNIRRIVAFSCLCLALLLILVGLARSHKVYDRVEGEMQEFGILTYQRVTDLQLVIDATFSGVLREGNRLVSTYDRSMPRGKQSCPT